MDADSFGFARKLHSSLENPAFRHCVEWDITGRYIVFTDIREYESIVLPCYHKTRTFKSLVRQLHLYGFRRGTDARKIRDSSLLNYCSFHHPLFVRGRMDLLPLIKRKPKSVKAKKAAQKRQELSYSQSALDSPTEQLSYLE
ncbi:HSF-type DNA-binding-domain-containing protein, partial [Dimargaris cristalligena]